VNKHWTNRAEVLNLLLQTTKADVFEPTGYATGHLVVKLINKANYFLYKASSKARMEIFINGCKLLFPDGNKNNHFKAFF
jgi:hypothetical protein